MMLIFFCFPLFSHQKISFEASKQEMKEAAFCVISWLVLELNESVINDTATQFIFFSFVIELR